LSEDADQGLRGRISRQGEEALGRIAEELAGNPIVTAAIGRAFEAREKAVQAQEAAMGALGIPSAADIERLTRRLRAVSQRLEGIEDAVDRLDERLGGIERGVADVDATLAKVAQAKPSQPAPAPATEPLQERLEEIGRDLAALREAVAPAADVPPRAQERLTVGETAD
jgi:hypothetical protein